jgi:glyoxylase I family protein
MIEIYNNPNAPMPDYEQTDPLVVHLAFACEDVAGERARLIEAGARAVAKIQHTPDGDRVAMLRDPWGLPIQLCQRAASLLGRVS